MHRFFNNKAAYVVTLALFTLAFAWNFFHGNSTAVPFWNTSLDSSSVELLNSAQVCEKLRIASGPTMPPPPDSIRIASGPTMPPPPDSIRIASGPTMPPPPDSIRLA